MKSVPGVPVSTEIELKLALPTCHPATLARRLSKLAVLAQHPAVQEHLQSAYYDTPDLLLHEQRVTLRLRSLEVGAKSKWVQTLKTNGRVDSALSQRGEWETPLQQARLSLPGLMKTPWAEFDPGGRVFADLTVVFQTRFERTKWLVHRRDGSVIEVALDIGQIVIDKHKSPICELELELKAGQVTALFEVAQQIAQRVAVVPFSASKAERGYRLARDGGNTAVSAEAPLLSPDVSRIEAGQQILGEMFSQFTSNLCLLVHSDHPEVVHQARIGWRRFRSALRLFDAVLAPGAPQFKAALRELLTCLGRLRDLDVARTQTLPPIADVYTAGEAARIESWQVMTRTLVSRCQDQRHAACGALQEPAVGLCLLAVTQWLEAFHPASRIEDPSSRSGGALRPWAKRKMLRLHDKLARARREAPGLHHLHRVRILAKRMRYNIEALRGVLPKKRSRHWYRQVSALQMSLGATRDLAQAAALVAELKVDRELIEFLRGLAMSRKPA